MNELKNILQKIKNSSIIEQLIGFNTVFFLFSLLFKKFTLNWLALASLTTYFLLKPWTIFTYSLVHFDFFHLFSNVLILFFIGNLFLTFFSKKQLITIYFGGLLSAAFLFLAVSFFTKTNFKLIGASGAITAVFVSIATKIPQYQLKLALIGFVKLWVLAAIWVGLSLLQLTTNNYGGAIAHIGGALFGFFYVYFSLNKLSLFSFNKKTNSHFKKVHKTTYLKKDSKKIDDEKQVKIDLILDKISKSGYDSLSTEEKEFLFKQGN